MAEPVRFSEKNAQTLNPKNSVCFGFALINYTISRSNCLFIELPMPCPQVWNGGIYTQPQRPDWRKKEEK